MDPVQEKSEPKLPVKFILELDEAELIFISLVSRCVIGQLAGDIELAIAHFQLVMRHMDNLARDQLKKGLSKEEAGTIAAQQITGLVDRMDAMLLPTADRIVDELIAKIKSKPSVPPTESKQA